MTQCRTCHAEVFWADTDEGKRIPIDALSVPDGNLAIVFRAPGLVRVTVVDPDDLLLGDDGIRYVSHFATCPNAAHHRKSPA